jgi:LuxR family transcriptional regulator, maltose regulon positive regulatory protein
MVNMINTILQTKLLIPPLRSRYVSRQRLLGKLNTGMAGKLIFISAPAGYGKTTLVTEWLQDTQTPAAWLSLDETDNDPARFTAYLIAALRQVQDGIGQAAESMLRAPQVPPAEIVLTALLNEITAISHPFMLILDDYHFIHTAAIHQQLTFLLERQPPQMHLVITTREDPLLPIPRLRARGQVLEVRQDELRFTTDESADFLQRVMGLTISSDEIAALERRTEGWIAGLQLAALSMQGREDLDDFIQAFTGSNRFVLDYLIEEVFEQQSPSVQEFLLKTSVLERLSAPLCNAVTDSTDSQIMLEGLEQANLFILPLDQSRAWYRYHRLFAELLRHRLLGMSNLSQASLHQKASQWYETNGFSPDAIHHALAGPDWEHAASLIQNITSDMLKRGEVVTLLGWYRRIPEDMLLSDPKLCFNYCWPLLLGGQFDTAGPLLEHVERAAKEYPVFLGQVAAAQAYLARVQGDHPRMVEKSELALALLPKGEMVSRGLVAVNLGLAYWHMGKMREADIALEEALESGQATGNRYAILTTLIFQGRVCAVRGQLRKASEYFKKALEQGDQVPINCLACLDLSALAYEWNHLEESERYLQQALILCERSANEEFLIAGLLMQIRLYLAQGKFEGARQILEDALQSVQSGKIPASMIGRVITAQAQVALARGDLAGAKQIENQLPDNYDTHPFYRFLGIKKAQLWIAQGKLGTSGENLAVLYKKAEENGWTYGMIALRVLQSLTAQSEETAVQFLGEALNLAQPESYIRTFVDAGEMLVPLLQGAARRGIKPEYVGKILSALEEKPRLAKAAQASLVEPLSEREIEVLRLVTAGLSNREIAAKLIISPGTAKTHIHNLCGKLGVRNRTEAAMRAKELDLV